MDLPLPRAHRIARNNYAPRVASFSYCFLTFGVLWIERGRFSVGEVFAAGLTFLLYPHLAYLYSCVAINSKRAELNNLYFDCLLLGLWTAQIRFALWPSVGILTAVCLNSAGHGHARRLLLSLAVFGAGAVAWGAATGHEFAPDTGPLVTAICVFGILAYVSWVGVLVFIQNRNLVRTHYARLTSEEQFRFIAGNIGELVAVLDGQGRFLFASPAYEKHFPASALYPGNSWLLLVHADDLETAKSYLNAMAATVPSRSAQLRLKSATGSWRIVDCIGNVVRDDDGNVKMIVMISRDRTAMLEAVT